MPVSGGHIFMKAQYIVLILLRERYVWKARLLVYEEYGLERVLLVYICYGSSSVLGARPIGFPKPSFIMEGCVVQAFAGIFPIKV